MSSAWVMFIFKQCIHKIIFILLFNVERSIKPKLPRAHENYNVALGCGRVWQQFPRPPRPLSSPVHLASLPRLGKPKPKA